MSPRRASALCAPSRTASVWLLLLVGPVAGCALRRPRKVTSSLPRQVASSWVGANLLNRDDVTSPGTPYRGSEQQLTGDVRQAWTRRGMERGVGLKPLRGQKGVTGFASQCSPLSFEQGRRVGMHPPDTR